MGKFTRICASKIVGCPNRMLIRTLLDEGLCFWRGYHLSRVPMRRVGHPSEVAAAIAFLAVNAVAFITGQTLFVDSGASLGTL
jgi:NAD(P)-dependent dehydrogenase (short-subunit alcohol dehydrogenase family)